MRMLTTASDISGELIRLIRGCSSCQVAVAWASVGFPAFDLLVRNGPKIERMVVGTHFYQTHPEFIETFLHHPGVRFVLNPDGVFHPKVYLFERAEGEWECLAGSPNFTQGGAGTNDEVAVLVSSRDHGAEDALAGVKAAIEGYWQKARRLCRDEFLAYREAWQRKRPVLRSVRGQFGDPEREDADDGGRATLEVPILRMTWADYYERVRTEADHDPHDHSLDGRLRVIRAVSRLFAGHRHFKEIELDGRRRIAGLVKEGGVNYLWFGSMRGAGYFKQAIKNNHEGLTHALDAIPPSGAVTRKDYLQYIERYQGAFPDGGAGVATATRLLAMKRPDTFLCLDARNKEGLCDAFGLSRSVGYEKYWDSIIGRVLDSRWWCSPPPAAGEEREVWEARAAFLDSLFYDGKNMPAS
jgi:hypothetical protein